MTEDEAKRNLMQATMPAHMWRWYQFLEEEWTLRRQALIDTACSQRVDVVAGRNLPLTSIGNALQRKGTCCCSSQAFGAKAK